MNNIPSQAAQYPNPLPISSSSCSIPKCLCSAPVAIITVFAKYSPASVTIFLGEDLSSIDSAFIRAGSNKGSTIETQNDIVIPAGTKRVVVAIPSTSTLKLTQVIDVDGMGLDVFGNFTLSSVNVEGLNNYEAKAYNVWVAENANGMAATHYNFIIG